MESVKQAIQNVVEITPQEAYSVIYEARISKIPTLFNVIDGEFKHDNFSWVCMREEQPKAKEVVKYCDLCFLDCSGGCIISCNSDLNLAISFPIKTTVGTFEMYHDILVEIAKEITETFDIYTWVDNNDIITENGKISGTSMVNNDRVMKMEFSFSLNDHKPLIDLIGLEYEEDKAPSYITVDKQALYDLLINSILVATEDWDL